MNGFPEAAKADRFEGDEYRFLIVASKFQTGFDQPKLVDMVVDKKLSGVACVQTLSRLNRTTAGKEDTFVLDFENTAEDIEKGIQPFYDRVTKETDGRKKTHPVASEGNRVPRHSAPPSAGAAVRRGGDGTGERGAAGGERRESSGERAGALPREGNPVPGGGNRAASGGRRGPGEGNQVAGGGKPVPGRGIRCRERGIRGRAGGIAGRAGGTGCRGRGIRGRARGIATIPLGIRR